MKNYLALICSVGPSIPTPAERVTELAALRQRMLNGHLRIDDVKRLHALEDLDAGRGCKLLRVLNFKLHKSGD